MGIVDIKRGLMGANLLSLAIGSVMSDKFYIHRDRGYLDEIPRQAYKRTSVPFNSNKCSFKGNQRIQRKKGFKHKYRG